MFPWGASTEDSGTQAHTPGSMSNKLCRPKFRILPPNLNNNWKTAVIVRSRHVTGWTTLRLVEGRIQDLDRYVYDKVIFQTSFLFTLTMWAYISLNF